jgi:extracellular factor (EF) 3-hydroxypalmitic acid methyl ester biosynthesis protein
MDIELKKEKSHPVKKVQRRNNSTKRERDKRHEIRKETARFHKTTVKIPLPFPKGVTIVKEVIDLSDQGLAFKMAREEGFLLPGTTIKDLVIYCNGKNVEKPSAEVMYAVPIAGDDGYKIGLKFSGSTNKRSALGRQAMAYTLRPFRYELATLSQQSRVIRFTDPDGQLHSGILKNISPYGLAFELGHSDNGPKLVLRLSDTIEHFQVLIAGEAIYHGKVTVANLRTVNDKVVVGVSFWDKSVDIQQVLNQQPGATKQADEWGAILSKIGKVQPAFKALVADKRYFLEQVKAVLDEEERKANDQGMAHKKLIEKAILMRFEQPVFVCLDQIMRGFSKLVSHFNEEEHAYHREYFQKQLGQMVWNSPFVKRCYLKPLGYAGDYEMMDMIYRDPYEGDSLFAKLLNKYYSHHIPPAQASRNRIPFLGQKIEQVVKQRSSERKRVRILSVGCGPANEVVEFIMKDEASNQVEFTLVDIEPEALYFSQERALQAKSEARRSTKINVYYLPLQQLLKENNKLNELENQDLIYSAGLFEYLSDDVSKRTILTLCKFLNRNGTLVIGNFGPGSPFNWCLEYGAEWYLIYRTQTELVKLAQEALGTSWKIYCEADPTQINNFLVVQG